MSKIPVLKLGDQVELIAPASRCKLERLEQMRELLMSWGLKCLIRSEIFSDDLLCANSDENRAKFLYEALTNAENKAVISVRGGYGSMRLFSYLPKKFPAICQDKLFIAMSDVTALNLHFLQKQQIPVIHGSLAPDILTMESLNVYRALLFGDVNEISFPAIPVNKAAQFLQGKVETYLVGGNLTLVHTSIGTAWEIEGKGKLIFLEEVNERGYRIDRMLDHLKQSGVLDNIIGIILGDFILGMEPNGTSLIQPVLERFANSLEVPVFRIHGVGHGSTNLPLPLGTKATLNKKEHFSLVISRND
jgi:muramoyltetrapeptide carboxypeptidase